MKLKVLILFVGFSVFATAGKWTESGKITSIYPKPSRNGIYFKHQHMINDGCSVSSNLFLRADQPLFKETYSLLLASYTSNKKVKLYMDGCQATYNYPIITEVVAD